MSDRLAPNKQYLLSVLILLVLVLITYANSIFNEFVWDDKVLIVQNRFVREAGHIREIFRTNLFSGSGRQSLFYRPLQLLTYIIDYRLWGLNPAGFHASNILLHLANSVLVYFILLALIKKAIPAFIAAALFAVHPVHSEAVTYVSGRADLLFLLFLLLSFLFYLRSYRETHFKMVFYSGCALIFYVSALLSKEMAVIFPAIIILSNYCLAAEQKVKSSAARVGRTIGYFIVLAAYGYLRFSFLRFAAGEPEFQTLRHGVGPMLITYLAYFKLFLFPLTLHMERLSLPAPFPSPLDIISFLLIAAGVVYLAVRNYRKIAVFGSAWYLLALLPVANLVTLNAAMAEHWLYLPSIGLLIIVGSVLGSLVQLRKQKYPRAAGAAVFLIMAALFSARTIVRNRDWKDSLTIFRQTVNCSPDSARAHNGLGSTYARMGEIEESIKELRQALALNPAHADAHNNLGAVYGKTGRFEESIAEIRKSLEINPRNADAHNNLGAVYGKMGRFEDSIEEFKKTLELDPYRSGAYKNLAVSCRSLGRKKEAIQYLRKYLQFAEVSEKDRARIKSTISRLEH